MSTSADSAAEHVRRINAAWLAGRLDELPQLLHQRVVMALPGFSGRIEGREAVMAGFADFCTTAKVHRWVEMDWQVDVLGSTAVVAFRFEMIYERDASQYRSTGRDLWLLERAGEKWLAVWRAMLDLKDEPAA